MKKYLYHSKGFARFAGLLFLGCMAATMISCEKHNAPSLFDPDYVAEPAPVITSIEPPNNAFAGIAVLTITGANFSATASENFVYFDDVRASVLEASPTQLKVKAPNLVKNAINIKIAVYKVEAFSNVMGYNLDAAVAELSSSLKEFDEPYAIACDGNGDIFVSLVTNKVGAGIKKITAAGVISDYAPKGSETFWTGLKVGPGGVLYMVRNLRAIFQVAAPGAAPATWVVLPTSTLKIYDIDFDKDGNMWAAGNNNAIFAIKPDKSVVSFPFVANVRSVRVYNGYLYLGGSRGTEEKIWRLPIVSADQLGPEEEYFDFGAAYAGGVFAITFAADGDMYVGTDAAESIVIVHPSKSSEPLYPGLFGSKSFSFAWSTDNDLYVTREALASASLSQTILRVNLLKKGAPYYGRGDTD